MSSPYYRSPHWRQLRDRCLQRDHYRCTVAGCRQAGRVADHKLTREDVPYPTERDVLENLRTLCLSHDSQVKEQRRGTDSRRQSGTFKVKGCTVDGWPHDPRHR